MKKKKKEKLFCWVFSRAMLLKALLLNRVQCNYIMGRAIVFFLNYSRMHKKVQDVRVTLNDRRDLCTLFVCPCLLFTLFVCVTLPCLVIHHEIFFLSLQQHGPTLTLKKIEKVIYVTSATIGCINESLEQYLKQVLCKDDEGTPCFAISGLQKKQHSYTHACHYMLIAGH